MRCRGGGFAERLQFLSGNSSSVFVAGSAGTGEFLLNLNAETLRNDGRVLLSYDKSRKTSNQNYNLPSPERSEIRRRRRRRLKERCGIGLQHLGVDSLPAPCPITVFGWSSCLAKLSNNSLCRSPFKMSIVIDVKHHFNSW